jgi:predicted secreted protein
MGPFEVIVVFFNAWWIVFLPILGIGTHSQEETGTVVPGTERGAPVKIGMVRKMLIATAGAAGITFAIWVTLHFGWLDFIARPPST